MIDLSYYIKVSTSPSGCNSYDAKQFKCDRYLDCESCLEDKIIEHDKHIIEQYKANINLKNKQLMDKVIEELKLHSFELGTDTIPVHYVRLNEAIEIVKQGGVSDDICEWKYTKEIMDNAEFKVGCNQNALKKGTVPNNFSYHDFKYCPYCGRRIKIVGD